jgi:hypothetical protein
MVARLAPVEESPVERFVEAVLALSNDPSAVNVARYLAASRRLEESRSAAPSRRHAA